jgi:hypothetical protein
LRERFSFSDPRQPNTGKRSRSPNAYPELTTIESFHLSCPLVTLTNLLLMNRELLILQSDLGILARQLLVLLSQQLILRC